MQNVTQLPANKARREREETPAASYAFTGGTIGFCFYWLAFTLPFLAYGSSSTFFFMLYTWPFFLALMPLSVLLGILFSVMLEGRIVSIVLFSGVTIVCLFWLLFSMITGW
ncbi:DUF3561 family protein [Affinibrenneria salicis]|uniref:DUF3561 family protein n=1 Tax=Affinibrenneria salicis TaxID=2590031 RepID=A0A5J5FV35_9GAMM|nr:DUF3561 family protein [Affinibrenneria salicis]KAA8997604.1 DUF3561 family protein [Affinibrenneria salicis]